MATDTGNQLRAQKANRLWAEHERLHAQRTAIDARIDEIRLALETLDQEYWENSRD